MQGVTTVPMDANTLPQPDDVVGDCVRGDSGERGSKG